MYDANKEEQEILKFWEAHKSFEKSITSRPESKPYHFYDGPPFATGLPHYGHIVASLMKDAVLRYFTMRGYRVERKWGWDCHGLPVENIIEKELDLASKKDIEEYGVGKFNEACRATVLRYATEWEKTISRMGRWVDMKDDYKTMDPHFMESVWWVFKELWDKGLIYKDYKAMHICPRCSTTLSNFEVTQGYKDIKDISVVAKFKVKKSSLTVNDNLLLENLYVLAWTTTPWTLPGNVLLAVGNDINYSALENDKNEIYLVADQRIDSVLGTTFEANNFTDKTSVGKDGVTYTVVGRFTGEQLAKSGIEYEPLFSYYKDTPNAFRVVAAEFVSTTDGTGVVHIAPAFGEDDFKVGKAEGLPLVQHVSMEGKFVSDVVDFAGMDVKPKDDNTKADVEIIKWLAHNGKLFSKEKIEHSYPHCWRCDTPLLNYATTSWFVSVTKIKEQLLANNQQINWVPEHIKEGRFGQWLEGARDWAISRSRYWGTPLPVWQCEGEKCDHTVVIGSVAEFAALSGQKITDLHKHIIDEIKFPCEQCGGTMKRIPEVLDCWFESGSMPYGQMHYPFENKAKFEASFPAEFIAEGQDQTRGWFYTLHVLATALTMGDKPSIAVKKSEPAFKNVIVNGIVLAEDGRKMSKRLKNYPEPEIVLEKYGADALRYYLVTSPVMAAESLNFSEATVREVYSKLINTLYNVVEFYKMYADQSVESAAEKGSKNVLDLWILAKLQVLIKEVTAGMETYKLVEASRPIVEFVTELSQWYVRRSRDRFKGDDEVDKQAALATLREVLFTLSKLMAPFTPFIAEKIYQEVKDQSGKESVHLEDWPVVNTDFEDEKILVQMSIAREVVELGLAARAEAGIKIRQPLGAIYIGDLVLFDGLADVIADELNVKKVEKGVGDGVTKQAKDVVVTLSTTITEELKKEGLLREIVRTINQIRKEQKLTISDKVIVKYSTADELLKSVFVEYVQEIKKSVLADVLEEAGGGVEKEIDGVAASISVEKA